MKTTNSFTLEEKKEEMRGDGKEGGGERKRNTRFRMKPFTTVRYIPWSINVAYVCIHKLYFLSLHSVSFVSINIYLATLQICLDPFCISKGGK